MMEKLDICFDFCLYPFLISIIRYFSGRMNLMGFILNYFFLKGLFSNFMGL